MLPDTSCCSRLHGLYWKRFLSRRNPSLVWHRLERIQSASSGVVPLAAFTLGPLRSDLPFAVLGVRAVYSCAKTLVLAIGGERLLDVYWTQIRSQLSPSFAKHKRMRQRRQHYKRYYPGYHDKERTIKTMRMRKILWVAPIIIGLFRAPGGITTRSRQLSRFSSIRWDAPNVVRSVSQMSTIFFFCFLFLHLHVLFPFCTDLVMCPYPFSLRLDRGVHRAHPFSNVCFVPPQC